MISHLFGHQTRRLTFALSPGGRKGRRLDQENQGLGLNRAWAMEGGRRCSWDGSRLWKNETKCRGYWWLVWLLVSDIADIRERPFPRKSVPLLRSPEENSTSDDSSERFRKRTRCFGAEVWGQILKGKGEEERKDEENWQASRNVIEMVKFGARKWNKAVLC